ADLVGGGARGVAAARRTGRRRAAQLRPGAGHRLRLTDDPRPSRARLDLATGIGAGSPLDPRSPTPDCTSSPTRSPREPPRPSPPARPRYPRRPHPGGPGPGLPPPAPRPARPHPLSPPAPRAAPPSGDAASQAHHNSPARGDDR